MSALGAQGAMAQAFQAQVMTKPCLPDPTGGKAAHRLTASSSARPAPVSLLDTVRHQQLIATFPPEPSQLLDVLPHHLPSSSWSISAC